MKRRFFYFLVFVLLAIITSFIKPHGDDFLFINYLDNCGLGEMHWHRWARDCILLPRGFWRPMMDLYAYYILTIYPPGYFVIMHICSAFCHTACAFMVYHLCNKLGCRENNSFIASIFFLFCTTSMGGLLPGDGFAQVSTSFWGLLSVCCYLSLSKFRYIGWFLCAVIAMFWKDGGFTWFPVAPILYEICIQKWESGTFIFKDVDWRRLMNKIFICCIPIAIFLVVYLYFKPDLVSGIVADDSAVASTSINKLVSVDQDNSAHVFNIVNFVKSFFVLYIAGLFPIDTSAIYFREWGLLSITVLLSLLGLVFVLKMFRNYAQKQVQEFIGLSLLVLLLSIVALITRAGEIAPHPSNTFIAILFGLALDRLKISKVILVSMCAFVMSTVITDIHKYYLGYKAGVETSKLAQQVKDKTVGVPEKVLSISVINHKGEGSFVINTPNDYRRGVAVIHEFGWKYPKYFDPITIYEDEDNLYQTIDSIINDGKMKDYDCIWINKPNGVEVINLKNNI